MLVSNPHTVLLQPTKALGAQRSERRESVSWISRSMVGIFKHTSLEKIIRQDGLWLRSPAVNRNMAILDGRHCREVREVVFLYLCRVCALDSHSRHWLSPQMLRWGARGRGTGTEKCPARFILSPRSLRGASQQRLRHFRSDILSQYPRQRVEYLHHCPPLLTTSQTSVCRT